MSRSNVAKSFIKAGRGSTLLMIGVGLSACVSPPRAVGPTTLQGPLPARHDNSRVGASAPDAVTLGPLWLVDPGFTWLEAPAGSYEWEVTVENPSRTRLGVTVIMQLLDADGSALHYDEQTFLIDGGNEHAAVGRGRLAAAVRRLATSWQIEYWVRLMPPPERRARRTG